MGRPKKKFSAGQDFLLLYDLKVIRLLVRTCQGRSQVWQEGFFRGLRDLAFIKKHRERGGVSHIDFEAGRRHAQELAQRGLIQKIDARELDLQKSEK